MKKNKRSGKSSKGVKKKKAAKKPAAGKKKAPAARSAASKKAVPRKSAAKKPAAKKKAALKTNLKKTVIRKKAVKKVVVKKKAPVKKPFKTEKKPAPAPLTPPREAPSPASMDKYTIDVKEADDNSYFILIINKARNFFTLEEMRSLAQLCHAAIEPNDGAQRLYNWLSLKRKDVLIDTDIRGSNDPALSTMYKFIVNRYKVKNEA